MEVVVLHQKPQAVADVLTESGFQVRVMDPIEIAMGNIIPTIKAGSTVIISAERFCQNDRRPHRHVGAVLGLAARHSAHLVFLYCDEELRHEIVGQGIPGRHFFSEEYFLEYPDIVFRQVFGLASQPSS